MTALKKLEERVAALEREVAELKAKRRPPRKGKKGWLKAIYGSMNDFPEFDEIVRLGTEWRRRQTWDKEPETQAIRSAEKANGRQRAKKTKNANG